MSTTNETKNKNVIEKPVLTDRLVSDYTFATRFKSFVKDIQVNDPMSEEELQYMKNVADRLLKLQIKTATEKHEVEYLKRCHPDDIK